MTQQTTMDRIFDLILSATQAWTQDEAAEQIAAEIDALTRERDEAREMIARLKPSWMGDNPRPETLVETCQRLADEVNTLTAQRNEARMDHDRVYRDNEELAAEVMQTREQRDEARAEVERLRPAAEAWEAQEAYNVVRDQWPIPAFEVLDAASQRFNDAMKAARARARAAKGAA